MSPEKFKPWQSMRREQEVGIALFPSKTILNSPKHHKRDCLLPTTADNLEGLGQPPSAELDRNALPVERQRDEPLVSPHLPGTALLRG